ncbi:MAG: flagellar biosynthesis protein FlhA [Solimonas sp.]
MTASVLSFKGSSSELIVITAVVGILIVLFSPIPPQLLDFLLITNFTFGLLILLLTFYMEKPLAFSTFPSVLLIATLFRLSLNVAATRLILSEAYAGEVIHAIGSHVVAGNYVVGLVVFAILIVVQFVVVTSGAQRVAEVAARFTLDAMPGKQMSIDADLNMGLITEDEARTRRREVEREANFYGAMDGASKFVKGDAVAGIIIILINIIGGLTIGLVQKGMSWSEALQTYTLLTVGDGIVTQIPALVIATGTGIIVTRAATDAQLTQEIVAQITRYPKSLIMVAVALLVALMLPGIPKVPVLMLLALIGMALFFAVKAAREQVKKVDAASTTAAVAEDEQDLYAALKVDTIEIEIGAGLKALAGGDDGMLTKRLKAFRRQHAIDMGLVLQPVRVREEPKRAAESYAIRFFGATIAEGQLRPDGLLAINPGSVKASVQGEPTRDPTFGLAALWIDTATAATAREAGYTVVDPVTVLLTHFTEIVRNQGYVLISRQETERLVGLIRESQPSLVEELIPNVLSLSDIQKVLQNLLRERVSVRNMDLILESLAEVAKQIKDVDQLTERVREKLALAICQRCSSRDGAIHVLTLDPGIDRVLRDAVRGDGPAGATLEPNWIDALVRALSRQTEAMLGRNLVPVLVCAPMIRRVLRRMVESGNHHLNVLSTTEISSASTVKAFGAVTL